MKIHVVFLAAAFVASALFGGCRKKQEPMAEVVRQAESALPANERLAPPPAPDSEPAATASAPMKTDDGDAAFLKPDTTSAEAAAADPAAYEAWFKKYHLDLNDPKMLGADPDKDGFANRDEFLANTDPLDPTSHPAAPAAHKTIQFKEYNEVRLPIVLDAVEGEKARIKRTDQGETRIETVKTGDTIRGLPLRVARIDSRSDIDKNGQHVDLSAVTLEDASTKEKLVLMKDLPAKTAASFAVLVAPDGTTMKVHQGDVFTWLGETPTNYKVIDLSRDQVVLQQIDNKKMWTIPRT